MDRTNKVRCLVREGRPALGPSVWSGSPTVAEVFASFGFDFLYFDMEHTPYKSIEAVLHLIRAANAFGVTPWVRVPANDPLVIQQVVELGALGVVVPHVRRADDAARAVEATRYPPRGTRGVCPSVRQHAFFADDGGGNRAARWRQKVRESEPEVMVIGLVEDVATLPHLDEILQTDIDGLYCGGADMSHTLGIEEARGDVFHPGVIEARNAIISRCYAHKKPAMCSLGQMLEGGITPAEAVRRWTPRGLLIYHLGSDISILARWSKEFLASVSSLR